ncbi:hypothetical protein JOM56_007057 [Amanita muscaria]
MQTVDAVNAALMECTPFAIDDAKEDEDSDEDYKVMDEAFLEVYDSGLVEDNTVHQTIFYMQNL